jgi:2-aminoethylphosphonate-pyruvate transaminase
MTVVILAAGMGSRLGFERPKGLLPIGETTFVERSVALAHALGLGPVSIVVGYGKAHYQALSDRATLIDNDAFASTGSLRSLMLAHRRIGDDLIVLESDLLYERRALERLMATSHRDVILTSGFTQAGDEVWVDAPGGRLRGLSKISHELAGPVVGEFVGVCRFSRALLDAMEPILAARPAGHYETDGVVSLCEAFEVRTEHVEDLVWGEVDDASHWARCQSLIIPRLLAEAL